MASVFSDVLFKCRAHRIWLVEDHTMQILVKGSPPPPPPVSLSTRAGVRTEGGDTSQKVPGPQGARGGCSCATPTCSQPLLLQPLPN